MKRKLQMKIRRITQKLESGDWITVAVDSYIIGIGKTKEESIKEFNADFSKKVAYWSCCGINHLRTRAEDKWISLWEKMTTNIDSEWDESIDSSTEILLYCFELEQKE